MGKHQCPLCGHITPCDENAMGDFRAAYLIERYEIALRAIANKQVSHPAELAEGALTQSQ